MAYPFGLYHNNSSPLGGEENSEISPRNFRLKARCAFIALGSIGDALKRSAKELFSQMAHSARGVECSRTPLREWIYIIIADIVIFFAYYLVLRNFTDSPLPVCDSLTTALSITATWMLSQKRIEYWLVFVFVDAFSACLYVWRGLYPSAVLFAIYTVMAVLGYLRWRKMLDAEAEI